MNNSDDKSSDGEGAIKATLRMQFAATTAAA